MLGSTMQVFTSMSIFSGHTEEKMHKKGMNFDLFRRETASEIFDYQYLADRFRALKKPRDKVASLIAEGKILRVKKDLSFFP